MVQIKVRVSEATNTQLDWMVAVCKHEATRHKYGTPTFDPKTKRIYETEGLRQIGVNFAPTTDWSKGGPIFSEAGIGALFDAGSACRKPLWFATPDDQSVSTSYEGEQFDPAFMVSECPGMYGLTELIAKARCYVVSRLGEEVEIPEELKSATL